MQGAGCTVVAQHHGSRAGRATRERTPPAGPGSGRAAAAPPCTVGGVAGTWAAYVGPYGYTRACVTPGVPPGAPGPAAASAAAPDPAVLARSAECSWACSRR